MSPRNHKFGIRAHIKRNTEGTSNEISLSVLDAARDKLDAQDGEPQGASLGKVGLFTLNKSQSTTEDAGGRPRHGGHEGQGAGDRQAEVSRRKAARRFAALVKVLVAVAAVAAIAVGVTTFIASANRSWDTGIANLDEAIGLISEADVTLKEIDALITSDLSTVDSDRAFELQGKIAQTQDLVSQAQSLAQQAQDTLRDSNEKTVAGEAVTSCEKRQEMLKQCAVLLQYANTASTAYRSLTNAWDKVYQADSKMRQAAQAVSASPPDLQTSHSLNEEAQAKLLEALSALQAVQEEFPSATLSKLVEYVQTRSDACGYAMASDEALMQEDTATAEAENALYNQKDAKATELASALPSNICQPIIDAYAASCEESMAIYDQARYDAAISDAALRVYLGVDE